MGGKRKTGVKRKKGKGDYAGIKTERKVLRLRKRKNFKMIEKEKGRGEGERQEKR